MPHTTRRLAPLAALLSIGATARAIEPPAVVVVPVTVRNVAPTHSYIGRVQAIQTVNIVARVDAFVDKVDFKEGGDVKAGQVLFELQRAPYQAALDEAKAALDKAQAALANATINLRRDAHLIHGNVITEAQLDTDTATSDEDRAQVASARASVETAGINLGYTTVTSPIDGRIGKAQQTLGNYVGPTTGTLATVVQVNPIRVIFSVSDSDIVAALQRNKEQPTQLGRSAELHLELPDGKEYGQAGTIEFVDNQVDSSTGTVTVWGRFANADGLLIPGGFVTVMARRSKPEPRPMVPTEAVQNDKSGDFVLVVDKDSKVRQQTVALGRQIGQDWIVSKGLTGGEDVIVQGLQKVHAGEVVDASTQSGSVAQDASVDADDSASSSAQN